MYLIFFGNGSLHFTTFSKGPQYKRSYEPSALSASKYVGGERRGISRVKMVEVMVVLWRERFWPQTSLGFLFLKTTGLPLNCL